MIPPCQPPSPSTRQYAAVRPDDEDDENDESLVMRGPTPERRSWLGTASVKRASDVSSLSWNGVVTSMFEDEPQVGPAR